MRDGPLGYFVDVGVLMDASVGDGAFFFAGMDGDENRGRAGDTDHKSGAFRACELVCLVSFR